MLVRELFLGGQRVLPVKAEAAGFRFEARTIKEGLVVAMRLAQRRAAVDGVRSIRAARMAEVEPRG